MIKSGVVAEQLVMYHILRRQEVFELLVANLLVTVAVNVPNHSCQVFISGNIILLSKE